MQQKIYVLIAAFLLFSLFSLSQSSSETELKPYFGQPGIKKKISELRTEKFAAPKALNANSIRPLKFRRKRFPNIIKPDKEGQIIDGNVIGREGDAEEKNGFRIPTKAVSNSSTQQIHSNFLSTDFYEQYLWPPDPNGDVGPTQVLVATNGGIKVFNKPAVTDPPLVTPKEYSRTMAPSPLFIPLDQFFSPVLPLHSFSSDPHIRYDRLSKRWFVVAVEAMYVLKENDYILAGNNKILLAVSEGDKITDSSSFLYYSFNSSLFPYNHKAPYAPFLDYPTLGVDKRSVLIGGNQYGYDSSTNVGYVIDKSKLIHGKLVVYPFELGVATSTKADGMYTPQGVHNGDGDGSKSFFAGISYFHDGLEIASIEYNKKNVPKLLSESFVRVEPFNFARENSSPGGLITTNLDEDTRLLAAAIYKNKLTGTSSLWTAHAIGVNQAGKFINGSDSDFVREARTGSRWYKIGNIYSQPRIFQSGTIYDSNQPSGRRAVQYFNPSIAGSGQGHSIVSGTTDAYNQYMNVFAAGRYFGDELGTSKAPVKVTSTTAIYAPYYHDSNGNRHYDIGRWGDFSQTVVDPLDDQTIWTFQEYANVDDSYGVRVVQFKAPPPATPPLNAGGFFNNRDTTIVLEGSSVDNSGFFDPGEDKGGPGYNRLSVKSTGGIIVSNIKFINPTKISLRLNIENKRSGQYLLIITNPDGQIAVSSYDVRGTTDVITAARALPDKTAQKYITSSIVYPNPATDNVTLQINTVKEHQARIVLIDVNGRELLEKNYSFLKGTNQAVLATKSLPTGTYMAAVYNFDNMLIATQRIVIQR